jgi:hypothetical protein
LREERKQRERYFFFFFLATFFLAGFFLAMWHCRKIPSRLHAFIFRSRRFFSAQKNSRGIVFAPPRISAAVKLREFAQVRRGRPGKFFKFRCLAAPLPVAPGLRRRVETRGGTKGKNILQ